jgi:hypothetical protein
MLPRRRRRLTGDDVQRAAVEPRPQHYGLDGEQQPGSREQDPACQPRRHRDGRDCDDRREDRFSDVEGAKGEPANAQAERQRDPGGTELQWRLHEGDRQHHAEPHERTGHRQNLSCPVHDRPLPSSPEGNSTS